MIHVEYYAPFAQKTGYAQAAHDYMLALHRAGVSMRIVPLVECNSDDLDERYHELIPLATAASDRKVTHRIVHTVPQAIPMFLPEERGDFTRIAVTTWETSDAPAGITDALGKCSDKIVVPSVFCANVLGAARADIVLVPHCFDPEHWPVSDIPPDDSPYSFYSVLSWCERKNPIGLIKAYLSEFSSEDDVVLRLKLSGYSEEDLEALVQASGIPMSELPALEIIPEYLDHEDMLDFYNENHVFVTAARGEGWNLPAFEAALLGKPVICSDFGGEEDYLGWYGNFMQVGHYLTPAVVPPVAEAAIDIAGLKVRPVTRTAPSGITIRQHWAEPSLYGIQCAMRRCYEDRRNANLSQRGLFESKYGYATVGSQFADLLEMTIQ